MKKILLCLVLLSCNPALAQSAIVCAAKESRTNLISMNHAAAMGGLKNAYRSIFISHLTDNQMKYSYQGQPANYRHIDFVGSLPGARAGGLEERRGTKLFYNYHSVTLDQLSRHENLVIDLQEMTAFRMINETNEIITYDHCAFFDETLGVDALKWIQSILGIRIHSYQYSSPDGRG